MPPFFLFFSRAATDCTNLLADIVFIMDASGSVTAPNFGTMKSFVVNFVETIQVCSIFAFHFDYLQVCALLARARVCVCVCVCVGGGGLAGGRALCLKVSECILFESEYIESI